MAKIFITGSADGLGQLSASLLIGQGHGVVLHARNEDRARDAYKKTPGAEAVLIGDLSSAVETKMLAEKVNELGKFDAIIHNAGVYQASGQNIFAVNTLAPFILTSLIQKPDRLIYMSSGLHLGGRPQLELFKNQTDRISYSDTKLHDVMLAFALARHWKQVFSNAVDPGWVPTKMGGKNATDNLQAGYETQSWLAVSSDSEAVVSGKYFYHQKEKRNNPQADDITLQEKFIDHLEEITGISFGR